MSLTDTDFLLIILLLKKERKEEVSSAGIFATNLFIFLSFCFFFVIFFFFFSIWRKKHFFCIQFPFRLMRTFILSSVYCAPFCFEIILKKCIVFASGYEARVEKNRTIHFNLLGFTYQLGPECENNEEERKLNKCVKLYALPLFIRSGKQLL